MGRINKIPSEIMSSVFLKYVKHYATKFKANKGFGRWLQEYEGMDASGYFDNPELLKDLYISILTNNMPISYIIKEATYSICTQALDAAKAFSEATFAIRLITEEIAVDDNGKELIGLSYDDAQALCKQMNEEAEEILFKVTKAK